MEKSNSTDQPVTKSIVEIDPDGDVVFQFPDGSQIQVSSKALSLGSPVFKAMFHSNFVEGSKLQQGERCQVELDDDFEAMTTLCNILHHRNRNVPGTHSGSSLMQLAVITDKYDCLEAISHYSSLSFTNLLKSKFLENEIGPLLFAALVFDEPIAFQKISRELVYASRGINISEVFGSVLLGVDNTTRALLPQGLIESHVKLQFSIRRKLHEGLEYLLVPLLSCRMPTSGPTRGTYFNTAQSHLTGFISECSCGHITRFLHQLLQVGLYPLTIAAPMSLDTMLVKLKSFRMLEMSESMVWTQPPCLSCNTNFKAAVAKLRGDAEDDFKGLCLDCIRPNRSERAECRVRDAMHVV